MDYTTLPLAVLWWLLGLVSTVPTEDVPAAPAPPPALVRYSACPEVPYAP